jgi:hypothetical protein
MSEPKTDTFDKLKRFMAMTATERDEYLYLQTGHIKSHLESEGILKTVSQMKEILNGTPEQASIEIRMKWMESQVKRLVKSNAKLQAAMYIATGAWIAVKFYFEFIAPHK